MKINIINKSSHDLPSYETIASAGMDLRAHIEQDIILKPLERSIICLLYTSPSPRDRTRSRMPSSA